MCYNKKSGFTLIELLTVIAIIVILMGIIFPLASSVKARAKATECMHNLQEIGTSAKMFRNDEHCYPEFIAAPLDLDLGPPYASLEQCSGIVDGRAVSLYPNFIKSLRTLKCPMSASNGAGRVYGTAYRYYGPNHMLSDLIADPMFSILRAQGLTTPLRAQALSGDTTGTVPRFRIYKYSSYDFQVPPDMKPKPGSGAGDPAMEVHYSVAWSADTTDTDNYIRQLRWRNPSEDTVITWCSFHLRGDKRDIVLFLDGHIDRIDSRQMEPFTVGWKVQPLK